ncbi:MAG: cytochrome C oxidase subunit IV family protein [Candidatus Rokubacteria bacterium]|nr:cytochrome C oxidase subunit IV family protein [Candidatus Rokubacteria bacterium]
MAQAVEHKHTNYMAIFWWLAILTVLELAVIFTGLPKLVVGILLCSLALTKASLVAMYFMHLRFETRTLGLVALTPLTIGTLLVLLLVWDGNPFGHTSGVPPTAATTESH